MLLDDDLAALFVSLADRVVAPDLLAGARRRFRRRRLARGGAVVVAVAVLATGTTVGLAHVGRSTATATLRTASSPPPPAVAAGDDYASVEQGTHDLILISADTGEHTVLHHTAPGDPVPATAVVSPSRRYVYYLTDPGTGRTTTAWRIPIDGGAPEQLPSSAHAGPSGAGGLGISPNDLIVSPDDSEYAYPSFDEPQTVYVQQVSGGPAVRRIDTPPDSSSATPIGWLNDNVLLQIARSIDSRKGVSLIAGMANGTSLVLDTAPRTKDDPCGVGAALLAGNRVIFATDRCSSTETPGLRVVDATGIDTSTRLPPNATTWAGPFSLRGFSVVDITPLPDGRALVRYDNNQCGSKPLPTVIYSPDGSSEPAYGVPASALHC